MTENETKKPGAELELRQSMSKSLLGPGCPADILKGFKPTAAMESGTLVDQILFGGDDYVCLGSVEMKSGPRKGQRVEPEDWTSADAKAFRKAMRADGKVPVLPKELREANAAAESALACLEEAGIDLGICLTQLELHWTDWKIPVKKRGTLDILWQVPPPDEGVESPGWYVIDLKRSTRVDAEFLESQVWKMKWDVQAAAYEEGVRAADRECDGGLVKGEYLGHMILAVEQKGDEPQATLNLLSGVYLACGRERWMRCGEVFQQCQETGVWPGHKGRTLEPPRYAVTSLFGVQNDESTDGIGLVDDDGEDES